MRRSAAFLLVSVVCVAMLLIVKTTDSKRSVNDLVQSDQLKPQSFRAVASGISPKVKDLKKNARLRRQPNLQTPKVLEQFADPAVNPITNTVHDADGAVAKISAEPMPNPALSFDGLSNFENIAAYNLLIIPPDTIGDVGPGHYVQAVNALVRVYDKNGNAVTAPFKMGQLFEPLGTACSTRNDGTPIVLYDPLADRWLLSQYCTAFPPFRQMIAISTTSDPAGQYFIYEFVMPNVKLNDSPKLVVWPDAYYMSTDEFFGADFAGSGAFAFERSKMLNGDETASYIYFNLPSSTVARLGNLLPADLDGLRPPATGSPNVFAGYTATEYGDPLDAIRLFDFTADFAEPQKSSFTERLESPIPVAAFDPTSPDGRADIAQPPPGERLDSQSDRLMYRVAYRNFGSHESLVFNQTVRASPVGQPYRAGVRLYELQKPPGGAFAVHEQVTAATSESSRWIGSTSQDHLGNLAVGYNHVNDAKKPAILYTGKLAGEPAGTLREEGTLIDGTGVQKAFGFRWGDYSGMSVDPADDCTFWLTNQYYTLASQEFHDFAWLTRIGKFKFDECTPAPRALISGSVLNELTGDPIPKANLTASAYSRSTNQAGSYEMAVLPGQHTLTAAADGFRSQSVIVLIHDGQTVIQNFLLAPLPVVENTGTQITAESCGLNGVAEPGETVTINISLQNFGALTAQSVTATLIASGGVINPGPPQNFGTLPAGGGSVTRPFTFTVAPHLQCGSVVRMDLLLHGDAGFDATLFVDLQTGSPRIALRENFDRLSGPKLPQRWTTSATGGQLNWRASSARSRSGRFSAFTPAPRLVGVNELVSPVFRITSGDAYLTFQNWYTFETTFLRNELYDGSVLEIKIGGLEWIDIIDAGGVFESGGYDGPLEDCCENPLGGRMAWSGRSGVNQTAEFITTKVKLPSTAAGQNIQLRWRASTDDGTFREGQYIDDIAVSDGYDCACAK